MIWYKDILIIVSKMEKIIEKLKQMEDNDDDGNRDVWEKWNLEEQKQLLDLYLIISKKESNIFKLIYSHHGCDSWEDIFRDYDMIYLKDKASGVKVAIDEIINRIIENLENGIKSG